MADFLRQCPDSSGSSGNVQTREERIHQVLGVKLTIGDGQSLIRLGLAADSTLRA